MHNVLESAQLRAEGIRSFNARCAPGIEPNAKRIKKHLDNSLMLVTALNPHIGYEKAAQISLLAYREDLSLKDAALKLARFNSETRLQRLAVLAIQQTIELDGKVQISEPYERGALYLPAGRTLLYPPDGDVRAAVDAAASIVRAGARA